MIPWILLGALWLQPVLDVPTDLRLASTGTGDEPVAWSIYGTTVATTQDGTAVTVPLEPGRHQLWAVTDHDGAWTALARPEAAPVDGAHYAAGWSATAPASPDPRYSTQAGSGPPPDRWVPALLAGVGLLLWTWPVRRSPADVEA